MTNGVRPGARITQDCILDPDGEYAYWPAKDMRSGDALSLGENRYNIASVSPVNGDPCLVRLALADGSGVTCHGEMLLPRYVGPAEHNQGVQPISTPTLPNEEANCG